MKTDQWTIRNLLAPVTTRLLIGGGNPFDLEEVLGKMEATVIRNASHLEEYWLSCWDEKARLYESLAHNALKGGSVETVRSMYRLAVACRFAAFLITPSSLETKRSVYERYKESYKTFVAHGPHRVQPVDVPVDGNNALATCLHLPRDGQPVHGSVVLYSGLGSCKEEMHILAEPLVRRGLAVLVPDMPGCGTSLFARGIQCRPEHIEASFSALIKVLNGIPRTAGTAVGCAGLCMGGGYAYRAASLESAYRYCAVLFPLFVADVNPAQIPQWMKAGEWFSLQTGYTDPPQFEAVMGCGSDEHPSCPFFLAHGRHDNWMSLERAIALYDRVDHERKEKVILGNGDGKPGGSTVLHTMPVGEQLHWVKHVFADWISRQAAIAGGGAQGTDSKS